VDALALLKKDHDQVKKMLKDLATPPTGRSRPGRTCSSA